MEKIEEINSILNKIELQYKEMQALTYKLQKSLSEQKSDESLNLINLREHLLTEIKKQITDLHQVQKDFVEEKKCKEFTLNTIKDILNEQDYLAVACSLERITTLLADVIRNDNFNQTNGKMFIESIKLNLARLNSIKQLKKNYLNTGNSFTPRFFDHEK